MKIRAALLALVFVWSANADDPAPAEASGEVAHDRRTDRADEVDRVHEADRRLGQRKRRLSKPKPDVIIGRDDDAHQEEAQGVRDEVQRERRGDLSGDRGAHLMRAAEERGSGG